MTDDFNLAESRIPKTSVSTDGAGNFPPGKTAVGISDGGSPEYRLGEELECMVLAVRSGGYHILVLKDGIEGYLRSSEEHAIGSTFFAQFLKWQDNQG